MHNSSLGLVYDKGKACVPTSDRRSFGNLSGQKACSGRPERPPQAEGLPHNGINKLGHAFWRVGTRHAGSVRYLRGKVCSPEGSRSFRPVTRPFSMTNSITRSENWGLLNLSLLVRFSLKGGAPGATSDKPVASLYTTCSLIPSGVSKVPASCARSLGSAVSGLRVNTASASYNDITA